MQRGGQPAPKRRYIAIQTLNPTVKQKLTYVTKKTKAQMAAAADGEKLPATWVETEQLHCLMVCFAKDQRIKALAATKTSTTPFRSKVRCK